MRWLFLLPQKIWALRKPVERDRWLFGHTGLGMIIFAILVATIVPLIIWGVACLIHGSKNVPNILLGNYDLDNNQITGRIIENDSIVAKAVEDTVVHHNSFWAVLSQYTDPGNMPAAVDGEGTTLALICAALGIFCLSGFAVSSFISFINRVTERWKKGLLRYDWMFNNYVVIIGCNEQTANIVKLSLKRTDVDYVLIQTRQDVEKMRMRLDLSLDRKEEEKIVFYYAERTSIEDIESLHLEKAKEIYILGEDATAENEEDHDAYNIDCLENISKYMSKDDVKIYRKEKLNNENKIKCHVNFEYQSTFTAFKATHIYRRLDKDIEFIPFNIHELWSKKVLVDNFAIYPDGEKGKVKVQRYLPIDGNNGINYDSEKTVHIVIVGMNQMGTAFGMQTALLAHYPNFIRDKKLRTTITFIDDNAKAEGDYLRGRFASLFDLCRYKYVVCPKDDMQNEGNHIEDVPFTDPMEKGGRYDHLGENFMDLQWEFIQGNVAEDKIKDYLISLTSNPNKIVTIAICLNHPQQAIATALYLPGTIFRKGHQVLVYQKSSFDLINKVANGELEWKRYKNMYPFGMIEGCYMGESFDNTMAKLEHFLYGFIASKGHKKREEILKDLINETQGLKITIDELWDELGIVQKYANIDLADSIPTKLRSIMGKDYHGYPNEISKVINKDSILLKRMAEAEHNRWLTERLIMSFRPVDKHETREEGVILKDWSFFTNSTLTEKDRRREKRRLIEKNRAHLDICSYEKLKTVDPNLLPNDENVIYYLPALLRHCERMNLETLLSASGRDGELTKIFKTLRYVKEDKDSIGHSFWMGEAPITEYQWNVVMNLGQVQEKGIKAQLPVVSKSKDEIEDFLTILRKKTGLYFTLPSLKEWEYAAKKSTKEYLPDVDDKSRETAWKEYLHYGDNKGCIPVMALKDKQQNKLGLYDMLGNVWEWTRTDIEGQESCFYFCGGSWRFKSTECNLNKDYWKTFWNSKLSSNDIGFRVIWKYEENCNIENIANDDNNTIQVEEQRKNFVNEWLDKNIKHVNGGFFVMGTENAETIQELSHIYDGIDSFPFVKVSDFEISAIPVTQGLWNAVMKSNLKNNKSDHKGNTLPQTNVSWCEIVNVFFNELYKISGKRFRLPTEAEWEYAAKGGNTNGLSEKLSLVFENKPKYDSVKDMWNEACKIMANHKKYNRFSGSDRSEDVAWTNESTTQHVGQKAANELGLYDMSGNVWEWCLDYYKIDFLKDCIKGNIEGYDGMEYQTNGYVTNPVCSDQSYSAHVFKGGSWLFKDTECANVYKNYWIDDDEDNDLGFRIVLDNGVIDMNNFLNN